MVIWELAGWTEKPAYSYLILTDVSTHMASNALSAHVQLMAHRAFFFYVLELARLRSSYTLSAYYVLGLF